MRLGPLPLLAAALLLAGCGAHKAELHRCASAADCAADAFCRAGSCMASAPPVAVVSAPASRPLRSHTILRFDGSLSHDPDPEDRVAAFAWTFRALGAGCEPFPPSATGQAADVVFPCGGAFEVELRVVDGTGHAGAPAALPLTVELSAVVPEVATGPDLSFPHHCQGGTSMRCAPEIRTAAGTFPLSATPSGFPDSALTYAWTVIPPVLPAGQPAPRVTIDPPDGPNPTVLIETDGTGISGEYLFGVTVRDPFHLAAVGTQRVTIENRPPVIYGGGVLPVPHTYDAAGQRFLANGTVPAFTVADPDGDRLASLGFVATHAGDGSGTFELSAADWAASFTIAVSSATRADGAYLIGGAGLTRTIAFAAADPNGGRADVSWDVQVQNRPPRLGAPLGPSALNHRYDGTRYQAAGPIAEVVDDDGDPLEQTGPTGNATCPTLAPRVGSGPLSVQCSAPNLGPGSLAALVGGSYPVAIQVGDPWSVLQAGFGTVTVLNRPPVVTVADQVARAACGAISCCLRDEFGDCILYDRPWSGGPLSVPSPAYDPDGDPLDLDVFGEGCGTIGLPASCPSGTCPAGTATLCDAVRQCPGDPAALTVTVTASDTLASASGTMVLAPGCTFP